MNTSDNPKTENGKKSGKLLLPLFFIFLLIAGTYLYFNFGDIITRTAEKVASSALGTDVKIGSLQIMPSEKKISVTDIRIANPKGFSGANALTVGEIAIAAGEISKELLNFKEFTLRDAEVFLEVTENGTNLGAIKENSESGKSESPEKESSADSIQPKVIIDRFSMTGTKLYPKTTIVDTDLTTVIVPDINLSGIGKKENGILAREAIIQVFDSVSKRLMKASASAGMLQGLSAENLKEISNSFGISSGAMDKIKSGATGIGEDLDKATEGIKNFFGD